MKINQHLLFIQILLISFAVSCNSNRNDLLKISLSNLVVDTTSDIGMFLDIVAVSKTYDSAKQRVVHIKGYIQIDKISKGNKRFDVEVYIRNGQKFVRIDSDRDGFFSDEVENTTTSKAKIIELKNQEVSFGKESKTISLFLKPHESGLFKPKDDFDLKAVGFSLFAIRNNGELVVQNKYVISVIKYDDTEYSKTNSMIYVQPVYKQDEKVVTNKIGDEIHLDRTTYTISSIEPDGSNLYLEKKGITEKQTGYLEGDYAFDLDGRDLLNGNPVSLSSEKEKLTLLDFWGTWCAPCLEISDDLKNLSIKYKDRLNVIGIACDNDSLKVKEYLFAKGISYANIQEPLDGKISTTFAVRNFPTFILLNSDGKIIFRGAGIHNFKEAVAIISDIKQ